MGMNVTVLTRSDPGNRVRGLGRGTFGLLPEFRCSLPNADFVVIALPSETDTRDLIGGSELQLMKRTAFIVNVGRAAVINEMALYTALRDRRIAGAGIDVWYQYPAPGQRRLPASLPFHELDNVIMTPHKPTIETMHFR
jgi:phosphoglycerate dehydrogenase-like enzyme